MNRSSDSESLRCCADYLDRLDLTEEQRGALYTRLCEQGAEQKLLCDKEAMMALLHRLLAKSHDFPETVEPDLVSVNRRLCLHYPEDFMAPHGKHSGIASVLSRDQHGYAELRTQPPLNRASMVPARWILSPWARFRRFWRGKDVAAEHSGNGATHPPEQREGWHQAALRRRLTLLALILVQTVLATHAMTGILPYHGRQPLEIPILILFAILFGWVSAGFWTALAGFVLLLRKRDSYAITHMPEREGNGTKEGNKAISPEARTAIIMPICNEDVARVFAGLRATYESLERTGQLERFDFFVLSDSNRADVLVAEKSAWADLCHAVGGFGRVFYRWRRHRIKRKSGNVADFCRRWGKNYRYMIVLDADSVMSGDCLTALVRLAEAHPNAGIIQTAPRAAGRDTFYARMQQFATRVYGPLFTAGLHFWQLGESHYWGHNAIIRVAPFMRHCALARLPGRGALAGEILSHDFVEAALMRRAGWGVWIAYDLPGSYEEMPPNLIDELTRDRRWCQGNLMNFRLFFMEGLHPAHRAVFLTGVMAYFSAPLWFAFLILSTALLAVHTLTVPDYFVAPYQLFPVWPEWRTEWAIALSGLTFGCLFLPKILSVLLLMCRDARSFGGRSRLAASMLLEFVMSALLAPIRMLFHTQFILSALFGVAIGWRSPPREDAQTTWRDALRRHGAHTLLGIAWAGLVGWLNPSYLWWLLPIVGALLLSIPISVYTSSVALGRRVRQRGLLVIPEETDVPAEIAATVRYNDDSTPLPGVEQAIVDPLVNALMCAARPVRGTLKSLQGERHQLMDSTLKQGPAFLSDKQRSQLINDPALLARLHYTIWNSGSHSVNF